VPIVSWPSATVAHPAETAVVLAGFAATEALTAIVARAPTVAVKIRRRRLGMSSLPFDEKGSISTSSVSADVGAEQGTIFLPILPPLFLRPRLRGDLLGVLGVAAVLRLAFFLAAARSPERFWSKDDREYIGIANHLHDSYVSQSGQWFDVGLRRPPVYPLFLRGIFDVFGPHYAAVVAVQLVFSVAVVGLVYSLAQLLLSRRLALFAALVLAIDPASIVFANQMMTETLFAFFLTLALALIVVAMRRRDAVVAAAAGLAIGLAALTRPVAAYLPLVLGPAIVLVGRRQKRVSLSMTVAVVLGFTLPVGGWIVRNANATGVATISTIEGYNMWHYRAVGALEETGEKPWDARAIAEAKLAPHVRRGDNAAQISREQFKVGLEILADHPFQAAKSWAKGEVRLLFGPARMETAILLTGQPVARTSGLRALVIVNALLTVLTLVGAAGCVIGLLARRITVPELWILVAVAVYLVVISGGPEAYSRFRVPAAPLFAVLAAAALGWKRQRSDQAVRAA
jgi:4-amino-4-deoxy-L-arabinose transferase-like glycosyltransferase